MEINNWFDLIIYSVFTIGVLIIGLPQSIFLITKGLEGWIKFGCCNRLPNNFIHSNRLEDVGAESPLGILIFALVMLVIFIWYLFIYKGGNLFFWFKEVKEFFS